VLKGDRCCAGCGFNLYGQTIVREPHYRMLMVRCPECGTAAAMQEYPTLSRITWRIRMALSAAFLAWMLGFMAITGAVVYAFAEGTMQSVLIPYTDAANSAWNQWSAANQPQTQRTGWWNANQGMEQWWAALPPGKLFADFGGWARLNWWGLLTWVFAALVLIPFGVVWSVALARLRGLRLILVLMLPLVFTALVAIEEFVNASNQWFYGVQYLVQKQVGWVPLAMTMAFAAACLIVGALAGRPIARTFLRFVLPARLLAAFSFLWIVDGKEMPRPIPPRG
jgi:hypothetical protein